MPRRVTTHTFGTNQVQTSMSSGDEPISEDSQSYKLAGATEGTETMTRNFSPNDNNDDLAVVAVKGAPIILYASSTPFVARIDNGSANTYSFANNTWIVYDKHGTRYLYGSSDSGRQYDTDTGTSTNTYK